MILLTETGLRINRYCSMADFPFFKMAAVFLKLEISTSGPVRGHNMRHPAKFREDRSNRSEDIADFRLFKMAAAAILDCFYVCWDHPRRVLGGLCDSAKFGCYRCSNFDSMHNILHIKLENAYSRPQNRDFGGFYPMGSSMNETPKRHICNH